MKTKQINEEGFDQVWKVMTIDEWDKIHKQGLQNRQIEWWKEEGDYLDLEKS